jgi:glutamate 5-kinase
LKKSSKTLKVVVKVGASLLTGGKTTIVAGNLSRIVRHVAQLKKGCGDVILVTSGAIACGLSVLGLTKKPKDLAQLQAAAAAGQALLMQAYALEFAKHRLKCGQILITKEDFDDKRRRENARHTVNTLLDFGVIPVFNENDAVSVDEIKFGDNDTLSARLAVAVKADGLLILTDVCGLYDGFDRLAGKRGVLLKDVASVTAAIEKSACGTDKDACVGGMKTKITAASIATSAGIPTIIASSHGDSLSISFDAPSYDAFDGTRFRARRVKK